jgi:ABC-2 type transport system permease protein
VPIFDQGYQHWSGQLSGHAWRWLAITRHGVRTGMKIRIMRLFLFLAWMPALALVFTLCIWGLLERKSDLMAPIMQFLSFMRPEILADPRHYRVEIWTIAYDLFLMVELRVAMVLILLVGPNLISQDLRFNALPLYFSRPLRRIDYFLGKLGVITVFLAMVIMAPALLGYFLGLLFSLDITILRDTFPLLLSTLAYGLLVSLSAGLLVLALSSLSRNTRYVILFWLGIWFVTGITSQMLQEVSREQRRHTVYADIARHQPAMMSRSSDPFEQMRRQREWQREWDRAEQKLQAADAAASKTDWRPLISYTGNLSRLGQQLLGTSKAWRVVSVLMPADQRESFLYDYTGPQYPWYWSAIVLAALFGLSAWILNRRVKSLDRLK